MLNINSWDMWLSTYNFSRLLQDWFHVFLYETTTTTKISVVKKKIQGTEVSVTFYLEGKAQMVFFPKIQQLCV